MRCSTGSAPISRASRRPSESGSASATRQPVPEAHIPGRVFDVVRTLLQRAAAERPLAVVFEDLHWADPASLDLIGYLVRSRGWPGAIVLTYRSDELHRRHPLLPWIAELSRVPTVEALELGRLGADEVAVQAEAILGRPPEPALVDELVQRAGGNAFITEELLASLDQAGRMPRGAGVTQVLLARVATLPDDARIVVDAMSVAGVGVDEATVASVIAAPELDVESAFRSALDAQLIVGSGDGYAFRHALLQEAVYDGLLPSERRRYHVAYARSLQAGAVSGQPPSAARMAEVAHHALAADDLPLALQASLSAGRAAASAGAFADASRHLERAVQLVDAVPDAASLVEGGRATVLRLAAEAASFSTDPARAVRLWEEAIDAAGPDATPAARAELLLGLALSRQRRVPQRACACLDPRGQRAARERAALEPPGTSPRGPGPGPVRRERPRRDRGEPGGHRHGRGGGRSPHGGPRARPDRAQPGSARRG